MTSEAKVWFVDPNTKSLVSIYDKVAGAVTFKEAQSFTASLSYLIVNEDLDGIFRGDNDVFVMSTSSMGSNPSVERVHSYEREVPAGTPMHQFSWNTVFATEDYDGKRPLKITLRVLDIDLSEQSNDEIATALNGMVGVAGAVFPVVAPYTFAANALITTFSKLYSLIVSDDEALKVSMTLLPNPSIGEAHLYKGTYVLFKDRINAAGFIIDNSGTVEAPDDLQLPSYAVLNLIDELREEPKYMISQKVAKLLTQVTKNNPNKTKQTIDFISETMTSYYNFERLDRYKELKEKSKHTELTAEEKSQMESIGKIDAIKPYLI